MNKRLQPAMGARIRYERTGRRADADLCSLRRTEQENRSEVLPDVHGRSSKQREPPRHPATESDGAVNRERARTEREALNRFGSTSSSPREMPFFFALPPFIARKGAVCIQFVTNRIHPLRSSHVPNSSLCTSWRACVCRAGSHALELQFLSWTVFFTTSAPT